MDDPEQAHYQRYRQVLNRYLSRQDEAALQQAYDEGREAIGRGLGVLRMAHIHQAALASCVKSLEKKRDRREAVKLAKAFLLESLSPFEATHRGFQDANARLNQLIVVLKRRNVELGRLNRDLEKEVIRRQLREKALRRSEEDLRRLSNQVLHVQEEERTRISRELHDEVGQALTAINVNLSVLRKNPAPSSEDLRRRISDTQNLLKQTMDSVHDFAGELRPTVLDDLGLIPALRSYVKQFGERTGIKVRFGADSVAEELDRARKTVLFRVAQESLNNVAKHAGASNVEVSIQKNGPGIRLAVKDDGKSFEVNEAITGVGSKRLGLIGMQERVRLVNGRLAIESKPRQGTVVRADVPLDPAKQPCEMEPKSVG